MPIKNPKRCPNCKNPLIGNHTIPYDDGQAEVGHWHCSICGHDWESL